jgi:hypothetical protein
VPQGGFADAVERCGRYLTNSSLEKRFERSSYLIKLIGALKSMDERWIR